MSWTSSCPACGSEDHRTFYEQDRIPVNSMLLLDDPQEARDFPTGSMALSHCRSCGFLFNKAYDLEASEYSGRYEASQAYSEVFNEFARGLARRWIDTHGIRGKRVLEIGGDKGDFLALMCELGDNTGILVDPAAPSREVARERLGPVADRIEIVPDFYGPAYRHLEADVVICRHTLEHIAPVREFMTTVREAVGDRPDMLVLFELPDVLRVLEDFAFWDVYYEHCSYFTLGSLARLFRRTGFEVLHLETDFDGQYLMIEARPSPSTPAPGEPLPLEDDLERIEKAVELYATDFGARLESWRADLRANAAAGRRTVIWGGGSKGVAYLTTLGVVDEVACAVDINPFKQGKYLAGSAIPVVSPERLRELRPDVVVAMNPIYREEIRRQLDALGVPAELTTVEGGPG